jgi:putative membrane protein
MIWTVLFAWLHFLAVGLTGGMLLAEYWLLRRPLDRHQARLLGVADLAYLLAAIGALATGLARLLYFGSGPAYYTANVLFWIKLGLFATIVLVSSMPTAQFIRWNREVRAAPVFAPLPRDVLRVQACVAFELALLGLVPLLAALSARGYGLQH